MSDAGSYDAGTSIGPYRLVTPLGEGGFGTVWRAEQSEPIRREVALKLIKPGMGSREVLARFDMERRALALMEHPNIAAVLDAGATANGQPYFVMELVRGQPITTFCDERLLTLRQRLELFIPVCQAVQHAHQKGVLHRDLKPSNILVAEIDGKPLVKVIDFGVAKALGQDGEESWQGTLARTLDGMVVGTPQYMSPEQAGAALNPDTRSDVYTLGVILYELLCGETPLTRESLRQAAVDEMLRRIREEEAVRPSSRLSPIGELVRARAQTRQVTPERMGRELRGDLDWITLRALEKERERRYGSAAALAADIQRHLDDDPVEAGPPSAWYQLGKFARRNRLSLVQAASIALLLVSGIVFGIWSAAPMSKWLGWENAKADPNKNESNGSVPAQIPALPLPEVGVISDDQIVDSLEIKYSLKKDGIAFVTGYVGDREVVEIPAKVNGIRVAGIDGYAFQANSRVRQVKISEGVETLGSFAFKNCSALTDVELPSSLKVIGPWAFNACRNLNQPAIPDGVIKIAEGAFADCSKIDRFEPPPSLRLLENYSFSGCSKISQVKIPRSIEKMQGGVFAGCTGIKEFQIEANHPTLALVDGVIFDKSSTELKLVHFPPGREGSYVVPASTQTIGERSFYQCFYLKSVTLPAGLKNIETQSFIECNSLETVEIPKDVESVMDGAFSECQRLKTVRIMGPKTIVHPEQVKKLGVKLVLPIR
jgi:serine/threonine protein kinase